MPMTPQVFEPADLGVVAFLVLLEALLSADNALVLAIMVRHLPPGLQRKALTYGLAGAFVFRFVAILLASKIISLWWLQAIGAAYLLYLPIKHFARHSGGSKAKAREGSGFWQTVVAVELADIAFAVDSVLAGVAVVDGPDKIWVVYLGAIIGVIILRLAASVLIRVLDRFPSLDHMAYVLVGWVGIKLAFMSGHNGVRNYNDTHAQRLGWSIPELPPAVFWAVMATIAVCGVLYAVKTAPVPGPAEPENAESP